MTPFYCSACGYKVDLDATTNLPSACPTCSGLKWQSWPPGTSPFHDRLVSQL